MFFICLLRQLFSTEMPIILANCESIAMRKMIFKLIVWICFPVLSLLIWSTKGILDFKYRNHFSTFNLRSKIISQFNWKLLFHFIRDFYSKLFFFDFLNSIIFSFYYIILTIFVKNYFWFINKVISGKTHLSDKHLIIYPRKCRCKWARHKFFPLNRWLKSSLYFSAQI